MGLPLARKSGRVLTFARRGAGTLVQVSAPINRGRKSNRELWPAEPQVLVAPGQVGPLPLECS